jgi:hypothetical protein
MQIVICAARRSTCGKATGAGTIQTVRPFQLDLLRRYGRRHRDSSTCKPFSRRRPIEPSVL